MNTLGRALHRVRRPAGQRAVRLQLQPGGDRARSAPRARGPRARGSVHRGLRPGDDRHRAATPTSCCRPRRSSRATTSRRATARSACSSARPVIEPVGEARPNADVFGELCTRLGLLERRRADRRARPDADGARRAAGGDRRRPARRRRCRRRRSAAGAGAVRGRVPEDAGPEGRPVPGGARRRGADRALRATSPIRRPSAIRWR